VFVLSFAPASQLQPLNYYVFFIHSIKMAPLNTRCTLKATDREAIFPVNRCTIIVQDYYQFFNIGESWRRAVLIALGLVHMYKQYATYEYMLPTYIYKMAYVLFLHITIWAGCFCITHEIILCAYAYSYILVT
jgi:hypothetical protein